MNSLIGKRLLIVEDEPDLREPLAIEFQSLGCTVFQAENGKTAFEISKREPLDVVISDIRMPGGDGVELLKNLKAHNHGFPVVMLITGFSDLSKEEAYHLGAEAILGKPFDLDEIGDAVRRILTPREIRWSEPVSSVVMEQIALTFSSLTAAADAGKVFLGRGGFFLHTEVIKTTPGKNLSFHIRFDEGDILSIEGSGIVRWIRQGNSTDIRKGLGIEFQYLTENARKDVVRITDLLKTRPYIPTR